jgi:hypothetical protein
MMSILACHGGLDVRGGVLGAGESELLFFFIFIILFYLENKGGDSSLNLKKISFHDHLIDIISTIMFWRVTWLSI